MLDADQQPAAVETAPAEAPPAAPTATAAAEAATPAVRTIDGPEAAPIELSGLAGGAVLKRLLPVVAVVAAMVVAAVLIWG